jgi:hypothetical protein
MADFLRSPMKRKARRGAKPETQKTSINSKSIDHPAYCLTITFIVPRLPHMVGANAGAASAQRR